MTIGEVDLTTAEGMLEWFESQVREKAGPIRGLYNETTGRWIDLWSNDDGISIVTDTASGWEIERYLVECADSRMGLARFLSMLPGPRPTYDSPERFVMLGEQPTELDCDSHELLRRVASRHGWGSDSYERVFAIHGIGPERAPGDEWMLVQ